MLRIHGCRYLAVGDRVVWRLAGMHVEALYSMERGGSISVADGPGLKIASIVHSIQALGCLFSAGRVREIRCTVPLASQGWCGCRSGGGGAGVVAYSSVPSTLSRRRFWQCQVRVCRARSSTVARVRGVGSCFFAFADPGRGRSTPGVTGFGNRGIRKSQQISRPAAVV